MKQQGSFKHSSFEKLMRYYMKETGSTKEEIDAAIENLSETENQIQVLAQLYSEIDASSLPDKGESDALIAAQKSGKEMFGIRDTTRMIPLLLCRI